MRYHEIVSSIATYRPLWCKINLSRASLLQVLRPTFCHCLSPLALFNSLIHNVQKAHSAFLPQHALNTVQHNAERLRHYLDMLVAVKRGLDGTLAYPDNPCHEFLYARISTVETSKFL